MFTQAGLRAADIMTTEVFTIDADASIHEAATILCDQGISGLPVRDEFGRIVGLISLRDVARFERERPLLEESGGLKGKPEPRDQHLPYGYHVETPGPGLVREFMTPIVISLPQETPLDGVIGTMLAHKVHRILLSDGEGRIVGLLSALDVLRSLTAN